MPERRHSPGSASAEENARLRTDSVTEPARDDRAESRDALDGSLEDRAARVARQLAVGHRAAGLRALLGRLAAHEQTLRAAYRHFQATIGPLGLAYAAEWLLDNYYVVQQALRLIREDMPAGYYRQLPKLAGPPLAGEPRVYGLARELVHLPGGQIDPDAIIHFLRAYQQHTPLTVGEVWALPIMLRLVTVECLAEAIGRIAGLDGGTPGGSRASIPEMATDESTVANAILSLRAMAAYDWKQFFEQVSVVEQVLRAEPVHLYACMDFDTRDAYRKIVEKLALRSDGGRPDPGGAEVAVARAAVDLSAGEAARLGLDLPEDDTWAGLDAPRTAHVGYYLVDAGRRRLEKAVSFRPAWPQRLRLWLLAPAVPVYLAAIILLAVGVDLALSLYARSAGDGPWPVLFAALLVALPASAAGVDLVNWLVTRLVAPRRLPKLEFETGIPPECQAMIVIPTLLSDAAEVEQLLGQLELHYLSNSDPHLWFALLTTPTDAPHKVMPEDDELLALVRAGIEGLNARHADSGRRPFYFFHRTRQWNPAEGYWLGWERKRGKLEEFNRLILGDDPTSFVVQIGDLEQLHRTRYVITLDADTSLPWESGRRLVGTLAHPLNRAEFDADGQVVAGYTLLQPRIEIRPTSANRSRFSRVYAGDTGLDLYTRAVSNVYQDLFGEGIFVGKGIYDVEAFARSVRGRVPDNTLLSHDLFEGVHGRAGLVTDVVLYEEYPSHYLGHSRRTHRWIRGDWQLLPWLLPRVPRAGGGTLPNPLSALDKWKIVDNLRRSLVAPALLALLIAGWLWLPGSPLVWTVAAVLTAAVPLLASILVSLAAVARQGSFAPLGQAVRQEGVRWLMFVCFLPHQAIIALDAVLITLARLLITRRRLLQWTTAAHTASLFGPGAMARLTWAQMAEALFLAGGLGIVVGVVRLDALPAALPLLLAWLISPQLAHWLSRPLDVQETPLTAAEQDRLRLLARRTWLFFERFVGPDDQWLPPDHFQEEPRGTVAHRTSPTNLGLLLVSTLSAFDLGYVGLLGLALRLRDTFETMDRMERHRGHFLNWYDTRNLEPLPPRYVSTVDSGNLAACLLALRTGCLELADQPVLRWARWQGLLDTLALLAEILPAVDEPPVQALGDHLAALHAQIEAVRDEPGTWPAALDDIAGRGWDTLNELLTAMLDAGVTGLDVATLRNLRQWAERVQHHLVSLQREIELLVPWLPLLAQAPAWPGDPEMDAEWQVLLDGLPPTLTLAGIAPAARAAQAQLDGLLAGLDRQALGPASGPERDRLDEARDWCRRLGSTLEAARMGSGSLLAAYQDIAARAESYAIAMDMRFLYDARRQVFHIGYNVSAGQLDHNYYDLLASEARIASLLAIAKGDVPPSHWLHLARPLTQVDGSRVLLSWSGTMFEYLMPRLVLRDYAGTFLAESSRAAVRCQIDYGRQKGVPWGISESGYYHFDANQNYQYRAFGVPALGFKRGLADDLVITPYASLLALPYAPHAVLDNLTALAEAGMLGRFGLYEAADYTRTRLVLGQKFARVQSFMAHHQGMILLSLANCLLESRMTDRLHRDPRVQSVELLLQERVPHQATVEYATSQDSGGMLPLQPAPPLEPWSVPVDGPVPEVHLLSNGRYSVLLSSSGGGYSRWQGIDLTRWRSDTTLDDWGTWIYVQDVDSGALWSAGAQPTGAPGPAAEVLFYPHKAEYRRQDHGLTVLMEVAVPPDDDLELRRVVLTNHTDQPRRLRVTSYAEVVLAEYAAERRHPAFSKLFVESEYVSPINTLVFRRRPRSGDDEPAFLAHWLVVDQERQPLRAFETDRARFLGRGRTPRAPAALEHASAVPSGNYLSGMVGATLDPVLALGQEIELEPYDSAQLVFFTAAAGSRQELIDLAGRHQSLAVVDRAVDQARTTGEREMRSLGLDTPALANIEQLYSALVYPYAGLRADRDTLAANTKGQPGLWPYAISGDYPIVLLRVDAEDHLPLVRELLQAHAFWRARRIMVDLVILNLRDVSYARELEDQLHRAVVSSHSEGWLGRRGGIYMLRAGQLGEADLVLLSTAARAVLDGERGSLARHLENLRSQPTRLPPFVPVIPVQEDMEPTPPVGRPTGLLFDNGYGGFSPDGREYVIYVQPGQWTPAPWINVIANPRLGTIVSEAGGVYSWAENSGENRLTPWANDPVSDRPGEALYLRDEETGAVWSPTPLPAGTPAPTLVRHGAGYTIFEHHSHGLRQELRLFVAPDAPVKIVHLRVENTWQRSRRLTATYYAEWVLGTTHDETQPFILPEYVPAGQALLARNPYSAEFGECVAFLAASEPVHGLTADRTEFLGRRGGLEQPAALKRIGPAGTVEPGLDPCAAVQVHINLEPGQSTEIHFLLGEGQGRDEALQLIAAFQDAAQLQAAWQATNAFWDDLLSSVEVNTPEPAMDLLLNRWLLYQAVSCRLWGRSALYQSSGAFGFRDQLQDVMALTLAAPHLAREHILRAAGHQFDAGDVLHWWHPPSGRGIRSRCSDDLLWLPFVTAHYVNATGDLSILSEPVPYLQGPPLEPGQEERYGHYEPAGDSYPLLDHCRRAIERGSTAGRHGLPLMGSGDWNDGMNRVGIEGEGESVWVGWFLHSILVSFAALHERLGEAAQAAAYREQAADLRLALDASAWDGQWWLRAFYDDGWPLGSARNGECQIDSLVQSWSVLSGGAEPALAGQAVDAALERLVREDARLIQLFTPPFDRTPRDPGYIKGYLPGIRENGGQYTHAALWLVWAVAELGHGQRAAELFHLLNPITHGDTAAAVERYRVEPYVVAADVYSVPPHTGRGGWTWYTGSAAWMYRVGLEALLGLSRRGDTLIMAPSIPPHWTGYQLTVRHGRARYHIAVDNPDGVERGVQEIVLDGRRLPGAEIPLADDDELHEVRVRLGRVAGRE